MRSVVRSLSFLLSLPMLAGDPGPLLASARQAWPDNSAFTVVCDYGLSRDAVQAAARAAGENGYQAITVVDIHRVANMGLAVNYVATHAPRFVLLLPRDFVVGDGTPGATALVHGLDSYNIPACSTSRVALNQGALFAQGDDTDGELLINDRLRNVFNYQIV
ncbi:MAG TPA: hypothetical protein VL181_04320, partial [Holophagaceae bacterium]|nr:hypothetical protein [Holophagaceae bacterium]